MPMIVFPQDVQKLLVVTFWPLEEMVNEGTHLFVVSSMRTLQKEVEKKLYVMCSPNIFLRTTLNL